MASKRLKTDTAWTGKRISFPAFSAALSARRKELGQPELPRNSGKNRTPAKRALLEAIGKAGGKW